MMSDRFIPLPEWRELPEAEMRQCARDFYVELRGRRTVRDFSNRSVDRENRPDYERPFLLLVVGYPAADARVPDIGRKPLAEIATFP